MDYLEGLELLKTGIKEKNNDKLFLRWCLSYSADSFDDFKKKLQVNNQQIKSDDDRSAEEILEEVKNILDFERGGIENGDI